MTPVEASCHQNRPAGVVRKDRSYAGVSDIGDRQNPGGLFQRISSMRKEGQ